MLSVSVLGVSFLGTGLLFLTLLHKPITRPDTPGSRAFAVTMCGCALWALSLAVGHLVEGQVVAMLAWSGRLVAPTVLTAGWFLLALRIANGRNPPRWIVGFLVSYIVFELLLLATNPIHQIGYDPAVVAAGLPDWNTWFWTQALVNYFFMGSATLILAVEAIRTTGLRRRQSALLALAAVPTAVVNIATISGLVSTPADLSPFGLAGSALILSWVIYRAEFLDIVPIARKTALEELPYAVVTLGRDGRVVDYNAVARQYFAVEDGIGAPIEEFFATLPDETITALKTAGTTHLQTNVQTDDGERRFDCTVSPLGPADENTGRVVVFSEITDRIRREKRLLEQGETLSEFATIVSHDIQGPLMQLRSTATRAVQTEDVSHIDEVLDAADRMDILVDDLVDLAQSGQQIDDPTPVSLATIADRAWHSVWTPKAELSIEADQTLDADLERLQQLLENCFRNAAEHGASDSGQTQSDEEPPVDAASVAGSTNGDGLVSVTVRPIPGGFAVDDDGPGIPPEQRQRVFDRGYTSSSDGTGLGLAIVDQIAAAHGWTIDVEESPTGGARFAVRGVTQSHGTTGS